MADEKQPELPEDWEEAVRKALQKKKPEGGWPKPPEKDPDDESEHPSKLR